MTKEENEEALREVAKAISDFRREYWEKVEQDTKAEIAKLEASGFDPARGRGRGPKWADGEEDE